MNAKEITILNAKQHNLKSISLSIPKNSLTVITGPSGSGKSSLAFDTLYAESQRRYIESLSTYARQFLDLQAPPDVEFIDGLSPSIAINQNSSSATARSTVGTITEIYNHFKILYARFGKLYCPKSNREIKSFSPTQIANIICSFPEKSKVQILAPQEKVFKSHISKFLSFGFSRARVNNEIIYIDSLNDFDSISSFDLIIDRLVIKNGIQNRVFDSIELALKMGEGNVIVAQDDQDLLFSEHNISPVTGKIYPKLEPNIFSFNSPLGACPTCNGVGIKKEFTVEKILFDKSLSITNGAIIPLQKKDSFLFKLVESVLKKEKADINKPFCSLPEKIQDLVFWGSEKDYVFKIKTKTSTFDYSGKFLGVINWLTKKYFSTASKKVQIDLEEIMDIATCPECQGSRLNETARQTRFHNKTIFELCEMPLEKLFLFFDGLNLSEDEEIISSRILKEITSRIACLNRLGLDYLNLNRPANTLSGGENQRIKLASQIGSALSGIIYVLDEPSIGLHQQDNLKLINILKELRDIGNTVIVVEHDADTIKSADYVVDIGPGAGINGGEVVFVGNLENLLKCRDSITGQFISKQIIIPTRDPIKPDSFIELKKINKHNIKNLDVRIPKGILTCVTGVSGSGKSTLINNVLYQALRNSINSTIRSAKNLKSINSITGISDFRNIIVLDQSPIGRNSKSNPATFCGIFDEIRTIFSNTNESKIRGFKPSRFSFNIKGGRCEECEGLGEKKIEMHFLPDVHITCSECKGRRYNSDTLNILYKGKNIAEILNLTILEANEFFKNYPKIERSLATLVNLGLGYLKLGQPAPTLSGGEAQRLKLARELSKKTRGNAVYLLDEPTTGLHFIDVKVLVSSLHQLVDQGHTVIVIEHNLELIKSSDYIIDMGPKGGDRGGQIIATGTPEEVSKNPNSPTGFHLKEFFS